MAAAYTGGDLDACERSVALDLLAYLALKGLWENHLPDEEIFYRDPLYGRLRRDGSPFVPYARRHPERYQGWRGKPWDEAGLRDLLAGLRLEEKALLQALAGAGGALRQDELMDLPMLRGKTSAALRSLKARINGACKQMDRAPLLAEGRGSGASRMHEIDMRLGPLRAMAIEVAREFAIDWQLLEPASEPLAHVSDGLDQ